MLSKLNTIRKALTWVLDILAGQRYSPSSCVQNSGINERYGVAL